MQSKNLPALARGASLVETLVAITLGLFVLIVSTKSVLAVVVGESAGTATKALLTSIEFARIQAAQRQSPVAVCGLDPRDAIAASGEVRCVPPGAPWEAGWIVYGDANLNGELDDGEVVLQVSRAPQVPVYPPRQSTNSAAITFRPIGTLASATPRRLLLGGASDGTQAAATQSVCVGIDGYTRVLSASAQCH